MLFGSFLQVDICRISKRQQCRTGKICYLLLTLSVINCHQTRPRGHKVAECGCWVRIRRRNCSFFFFRLSFIWHRCCCCRFISSIYCSIATLPLGLYLVICCAGYRSNYSFSSGSLSSVFFSSLVDMAATLLYSGP